MGNFKGQNKPVRVEREDLPEIDIQWFAEDQQGGDGDGDGVTDDSTRGADDVDITSLPGWSTIFTEDVRRKHFDTLKDCEKPDNFFDKYSGLSEKLKTAIIPPGKDSTDEEKAAFKKLLGVPEDKTGYKLKLPEETKDLSDDLKTFDSWFLETAHKLNFSKSQAEDFYTEYARGLNQIISEQRSERDKVLDKLTDSLKKEWKDDLEKNTVLAKRAFKVFSDDDFYSFLDEQKLLEDPRMLKVFHSISSVISEDVLESGSLKPDTSERKPGELSYPDIREEFPDKEE